MEEVSDYMRVLIFAFLFSVVEFAKLLIKCFFFHGVYMLDIIQLVGMWILCVLSCIYGCV